MLTEPPMSTGPGTLAETGPTARRFDVQLFTSEVPRMRLLQGSQRLTDERNDLDIAVGALGFQLQPVLHRFLRGGELGDATHVGAPVVFDDIASHLTHLPCRLGLIDGPFQPKLGRCEHRRLVLARLAKRHRPLAGVFDLCTVLPLGFMHRQIR